MHSIPELISDIRQGKMIILLDNEDRENEGDIVIAADLVRPEHINFMVKYARGLVCLPLAQQTCQRLQLPLMVAENQARLGTNFTVSIDAAEGVTTGISAFERAHTIKTVVAKNAKPKDLARPGHIFPIMAMPGGVKERPGHTEASVELATLAGLSPAAVICEILAENGEMARRPQLEIFATEHGLKMGTIADLIEYQQTQKITEVVN